VLGQHFGYPHSNLELLQLPFQQQVGQDEQSPSILENQYDAPKNNKQWGDIFFNLQLNLPSV
jgi:hypothetical protein